MGDLGDYYYYGFLLSYGVLMLLVLLDVVEKENCREYRYLLSNVKGVRYIKATLIIITVQSINYYIFLFGIRFINF
jgi:hypothetical protein